MLRKLSFSTFLLLVAALSHAQLSLPVLPSPEFNSALEKIVVDFRYNFKNIIGDTINTQGEVETYSSKVTLPGTYNCTINKYHSAKDTTASWQAIVYKGDDYKEAVKAYRRAFNMVNKSRMQLIDLSAVGFKGTMEQPSEALKFTVSTLQLNSDDIRYKRFTAEVELLANYTDWQVNINLSNKKPDAEKE